jgi:two-component system, NtrC family, sensor kinase
MALRFTFKTLIIVLITLILTVLGIINATQQGKYIKPDDGCGWIATSSGVQAVLVEKEGPGDRAGIRKGDFLLAIEGQPIHRASDVDEQLKKIGIWSKTKYSLMRGNSSIETRLIVAPQNIKLRFKRFLEIVGFSYLFIGVFIFLRRWQARRALHFYSICLASFVLYAYSYTGKLNTFDKTVYWLNEICWILLPPLFLHFCTIFPRYKGWLREFPRLAVLFYLPGSVLFLVQLMFYHQLLNFIEAPLLLRFFLDRLHIGYFGAFFALGAFGLIHTYYHSVSLTLRQQMRWIVLGTSFGTFPFLLVYAIPYWFGVEPSAWMDASALFLILIPITFGNAIIKYRLMDVDIIFKRGVASTLASLAVVGFYFVLIGVVSEVFRASGASRIWVIISLVVTAFVFTPLRNWIQSKVDEYFYRDRYDYRRTLIEFGKTLGAEVNLKRLLDTVVERISQTLSVDKIALFLNSDNQPYHFVLAKSLGLSISPLDLDTGFLDPRRPVLVKGYLFYENFKTLVSEPPEYRQVLKQLDLYYYLPCIIKGNTIAFIGLGRTSRGDLLTSEDVELLQTIAGYVAIAIENSRLYESIHEKADQLAELKEFNESILESITVGVIVVGLDERVESWNSKMEMLFKNSRGEVLGRTLEEVLPAQLMEGIRMRMGLGDVKSAGVIKIYKLPVKVQEEALVLDVTVTPLLGKTGQVAGRVVILDDKTERAKMEDQLIQSEKLTSIGLLAAGVAHEVNTPLAVISSYSQMLLKQIPAEDPRFKILDKIVKQSFRASEIVNSLLNFSRTSGSEFRHVDLNGVITDTLSLLEHQFKVAKVRVKKEFDSSFSEIFGNPGKLQQVFLNLFINAKDAMPGGGVLTVRTSSYDSVFRVEVIDSGIGISSDNLNKIYDPFFTTKEMGRGTGLGLSVSYGIIQEHSGKITVDSSLGQGTRFILELPAARKVANV